MSHKETLKAERINLNLKCLIKRHGTTNDQNNEPNLKMSRKETLQAKRINLN